MMPDLVEYSKKVAAAQPEENATTRRNRTQAKIGLASNVVGLTAAGAATTTATREFAAARRKAKGLAPKAAGTGRLARWSAKVKGKHAVGLAGGALLLQGGNTVGDMVANRVLARSAKTPTSKGMTMTGDSYSDVYESEGHGDGRGHSLQAVEKALIETPQMMLGTQLPDEEILKRARRFDPEADRQRRMGLYAGAGAGGAMVAGAGAAHHLKDSVKGRTITIPKIKHKGLTGTELAAAKKGRKGLGLAALAAASGAGGAAAYRHGISHRNQPYN